MAERSLIYRDQTLQPASEISDQRGLSVSFEWLEDAMEASFRHLGAFLRITAEGDGDTADVADIADELLKGAKQSLTEKFNLIEEHFGVIKIGHFAHWPECKSAGVAGQFVGIMVERQKGCKREAVALVEQEPRFPLCPKCGGSKRIFTDGKATYCESCHISWTIEPTKQGQEMCHA